MVSGLGRKEVDVDELSGGLISSWSQLGSQRVSDNHSSGGGGDGGCCAAAAAAAAAAAGEQGKLGRCENYIDVG